MHGTKILLHISPKTNFQIINKPVKTIINSAIILNLIEEFVPKVIERGWKEILLRFFDTIFEAGYSEAEEAVSRRPVTEYHLIRLCQGFARQAAELCGTDLTRLIGESRHRGRQAAEGGDLAVQPLQ